MLEVRIVSVAVRGLDGTWYLLRPLSSISDFGQRLGVNLNFRARLSFVGDGFWGLGHRVPTTSFSSVIVNYLVSCFSPNIVLPKCKLF